MGWPSGLRRRSRKPIGEKSSREFKSHPHRMHHSRKKKLRAALILTGVISIGAVLAAYFVQKRGQARLTNQCSYLDPPIIDLLAFSAAVFLICEGFHQILKHESAFSFWDKIFVAVRIAFGFAILTIHLIQFAYK